ncbi:MAG: hypothetical protein D6736_15505 [Nitrospinota bacterium]|nr:MAG: hypothetical protein D6736_15505 [Nitrospinota bacterium]
MDSSKLDRLARQLEKVIHYIHTLQEEKRRLEQRVRELEAELAEQKADMDRLRREHAQTANILNQNKRLLEERDIIRRKVEKMLRHLEAMNIGLDQR